MPALFTADRAGFVERWIVASHLAPVPPDRPKETPGDHRAGRQVFLSIGCVACHFVPEEPRKGQADLDRVLLRGLGDRMTPNALARFLADPHTRYPDGRMPRLPLAPKQARDVAAYLLLWSPANPGTAIEAPGPAEIVAVYARAERQDPGRRGGGAGGRKAVYPVSSGAR